MSLMDAHAPLRSTLTVALFSEHVHHDLAARPSFRKPFDVVHDLTLCRSLHSTTLSLHSLSPLKIDFSMMTSMDLPKAPSNNAFAQPREQLQ
jgi:hypothetical protein